MSRQLTSGVLGRRKFPTKGLFSYWKLDGTSGPVIDSWGDADGSNDFGATRGVEGKIGNCFSFVGSGANNQNNQRIVLPNNSDAIRNVGQITMAAWIKPTYNNRSEFILSYTNQAGSGARMQIGMSSGSFVIAGRRRDVDNYTTFNSGYTVDVSNWQFVVGVVRYDIGQAYTYVNGELVNSGSFLTSGLTDDTSSGASAIGSQGTDTFGYTGLIDEVGIWQRALTQEEITKLYNNGNGITL